MTIWILMRAAGIGAYVALYLSVAVGPRRDHGRREATHLQARGQPFHAFVASTGLFLLALHLVLLVIHDFMPFSCARPARPDALDVSGRVALSRSASSRCTGWCCVVVSSWLRSRFSVKLWRTIHLLAVPTFLLALLHGVFGGTDTERPWMIALYVATGHLDASSCSWSAR